MTNDTTPTACAGHPVDAWTSDQWAALRAELRELKDSCGSNKHDRALILISACIEGGLNTIGQIITMLTPLGLNRGHIVRMLKERGGWFARMSGAFSASPTTRMAGFARGSLLRSL